MRLLSRALRAAQGCRAATLAPRRLRAAPVARLSGRPGLEELFAAPSLRRLLEARARAEGGAAPQLAAHVRRLRDKERELRDTRELAQGAGAACVTPPGSGREGRAEPGSFAYAGAIGRAARGGGAEAGAWRRAPAGVAAARAGGAPRWRESGARVSGRGA